LGPATASRASGLNKTGNAVGRAGKAITNNPGKVGLATGAALGGAAGAALAGSGQGASTTPVVGGKAKPAVAAPTVAAPEADAAGDKELAELKVKIDALIGDLSKSQNPEIQKSLASIKSAMGTSASGVAGVHAGSEQDKALAAQTA
jgi:hypothetical protein